MASEAAENLTLLVFGNVDQESVRRDVELTYAETRVAVAAYVRYLGLTQSRCEEVLQDTYLRLYQALLARNKIENRKAWLFRVAHNEAVQARKHERLFAAGEPDWSRLLHPSDSPERALLNREQLQRVRQAFGSLSPQQRHCLYLRSEGLRYREIAETLGITISSVNEFLRRALIRLGEAAHA